MGAPRWKLVAPVAVGLVSVSVAAGVLVTAVSPASATGGLCASYPGSGSGTAGDPYLVSTATELAALDACANAGQTGGAYFKQTAPISLAGYANWNPIGTGNSSGTRFSGIYDGPGACSGALPVPVGAQSGQQTLQVNGYAGSGSVRSLSLGIQVTPARVAMTRQAQVSVFFAPLSPEISAKGRKSLDRLVQRTKKYPVRSMVLGFVQQTRTTSNDMSLSTQRATNVATYLRERGLKGTYVVRGDGIAGPGASARRVNAQVTYQTGCPR